MRVSSTLVCARYVINIYECVVVVCVCNITISVMCAISVYVKRHESSAIFNHGNEHLKRSITIEVGHSNRMREKNSRILFCPFTKFIRSRFLYQIYTFDSNNHKIARACMKNLLISFRNGTNFLFHILCFACGSSGNHKMQCKYNSWRNCTQIADKI